MSTCAIADGPFANTAPIATNAIGAVMLKRAARLDTSVHARTHPAITTMVWVSRPPSTHMLLSPTLSDPEVLPLDIDETKMTRRHPNRRSTKYVVSSGHSSPRWVKIGHPLGPHEHREETRRFAEHRSHHPMISGITWCG